MRAVKENRTPDFSRFTCAAVCSNMSAEELQDKVNMRKKLEKAQTLHPYPVRFYEGNGYVTYINDPAKGKRRIRAATEESLWVHLADWYENQMRRKDVMLPEVYAEWLETKRTPRNGSNIRRIEKSWEAYYLNEPLSKQIITAKMKDLTAKDLRIWAENLLKKNDPCDRKKFYRMFSIIKNCFEYAMDEDNAYITENAWEKAQKKINRELIVAKDTPLDEEQVFTDKERQLLKKYVYEDLEKYPHNPTSAGLQILFLLETGLRMGEVCGLKFSDLKGSQLSIQRQANNNGVQEWTKTTHGRRDIPLTDEARRILQDVADYNEKHNLHAEWIFQSGNPNYDYRLSYHAASRKLEKLCRRIGTVSKSPHKLRKTCLSILLDNPNVNDRTVQRFAGHADLSTTYRYYNFERRTKEEQAEAINEALKL